MNLPFPDTGEARPIGRRNFLGLPFEKMDAEATLAVLKQRTELHRFAYVVTPNVDHVVRASREPALAGLYHDAFMSWCDSRPLRLLARLRGIDLPLMPGSDMTARLFDEVLRPGDRIVCVTADDALLSAVRGAYPHIHVDGFSPPHGFDTDPAAFAACVDYIAATPARFVFIGVGFPRSERLAQAVQQVGLASGTAFCIGASLEFITGRKRRAPHAIQRIGLEWLHRLASEPRRLWRRYLLAFAPLARLYLRDLLGARGAGRPLGDGGT